MIAWFKSLGWVAAGGIVLGAVLLAMKALKSGREDRRADKAEAVAVDLLNSGIGKKVRKGRKLMEKSEVHKNRAIAAREGMEIDLEKLGEANADMDAIAHRFNSKRMRD